MALTFADNSATDEIVFATGMVGNIGTMALWVKIASIANAWRTLCSEGNDTGGNGGINQRGPDGSSFHFEVKTDGATKPQGNSLTGTLVAGEWAFIAATWSIGVSCVIYKGTLAVPCVSVIDGVAILGAGNHSLAAEAFTIGALSDVTACGMDVAFCAVYNSVLTLSQLRAIQYSRRIVTSGCLGQYFPGMYGAADGAICYDKSGNARTGTQAGALVLASDVPLGPPFGWAVGIPYAVAVGGLSIPVAMRTYMGMRNN